MGSWGEGIEGRKDERVGGWLVPLTRWKGAGRSISEGWGWVRTKAKRSVLDVQSLCRDILRNRT